MMHFSVALVGLVWMAHITSAAPIPPLNPEKLLLETEALFLHGYNSYMKHAFPKDELCPLSCTGRNTLGPYALTLVDALDMLYLIDKTKFNDAVEWTTSHITFEMPVKISVFETNIRILGAMLSAYHLTTNAKHKQKLIALSVDLAGRLLPAFDTPTGICYNEIYLQTGVADNEGQVTCPAAAGTLMMEFGMLSHITGNCSYLAFARRSLNGVWRQRSFVNLLGTIINVQTGLWTHVESNIGASIDSFYEYLLKSYVLFHDHRLFDRWLTASKAATKYMSHNSWFLTVRFDNAELVNEATINALQAFWPGMLVLGGDVAGAVQSFQNFYCVHEVFGFLPEVCHLDNFFRRGPQGHNSLGYPLRPEFIESAYFLYQATRDITYVRIGAQILQRLQTTARVPCGIAAIKNVQTGQLEDKMDSFILSETLKYLYLLFREASGKTDNPWGYPGGVVYTTEAHPFPLSAEITATYTNCSYTETGSHIFGVPLWSDRSNLRAAESYKDKEMLSQFEYHPPQYFEKRMQCQRISPWQSQPSRSQNACTTTDDGIQQDRMRRHRRVKVEQTAKAAAADEPQPSQEQPEDTTTLSFTLPRDPKRLTSKPLTARIPALRAGARVVVRAIPGGVSITNFSPEAIFDSGLVHFGIAWGDSDPLNTNVYFVNNATFGPSLKGFASHHFEVLVETPQSGCVPYPMDAHKHFKDRAVAIARGGCTFQKKVLNAQEAGAGLVIIVNHEHTERVHMGPDEELKSFPIHIPSVLISHTMWEEIAYIQATNGIVYFRLQTCSNAVEQFGILGYTIDQSVATSATRIVLKDLAHTLALEDENYIRSTPAVVLPRLPHEKVLAGGRVTITHAKTVLLSSSSLPADIKAVAFVQKTIAVDTVSSIEIDVVTHCNSRAECSVAGVHKTLSSSLFPTEEATLMGRFTTATHAVATGGIVSLTRIVERDGVHPTRVANAATHLLRELENRAIDYGCWEGFAADSVDGPEWVLVLYWPDVRAAQEFFEIQKTPEVSNLAFRLAMFLGYFVEERAHNTYEVLRLVHGLR